jgi:hypothetical protein
MLCGRPESSENPRKPRFSSTGPEYCWNLHAVSSSDTYSQWSHTSALAERTGNINDWHSNAGRNATLDRNCGSAKPVSVYSRLKEDKYAALAAVFATFLCALTPRRLLLLWQCTPHGTAVAWQTLAHGSRWIDLATESSGYAPAFCCAPAAKKTPTNCHMLMLSACTKL